MDSTSFQPLKGLLAGLVATAVLSMIMIGKSMMGLMPGLNAIAMLSHMMGAGMAMGWVAHFMIGTVAWGLAFAFLSDKLPGSTPWLKGILFGIGAWLLMMVAVMPMAGAGLFGLKMGMMAPVMTLMLHIVFGAVLGVVYGQPDHRES